MALSKRHPLTATLNYSCQYCGLATTRDTFCCLECAKSFVRFSAKYLEHHLKEHIYREADYV